MKSHVSHVSHGIPWEFHGRFLLGLQKVLAYCTLTIPALIGNLVNRRSVPTMEHQ
jgi:hypothetical protein